MKKNKKIFIALILIFGLPFLAANVFYFYHDYFHYQTKNHGTFVQRTYPIKSLETSEKKPLWQMLYVIDQDCDFACANNLYKMRQIRLALNQEQDKARGLIFLLTQIKHPILDEYLKKDYSMIQLIQSMDAMILKQNYLYIADPKGRVILAYQNNANPKDILNDLKHLIKVNSP